VREEQEGEDADGDGCVLGFQDELGFGGLEAEWAAQVDRVGRELKRGWMMGFGVGWGAGFISRRRCGRSFY
jgi:hypothetical protein